MLDLCNEIRMIEQQRLRVAVARGRVLLDRLRLIGDQERKECSPSEELTRATIQARRQKIESAIADCNVQQRALIRLLLEHLLKCDVLMELVGRDQFQAFMDDPDSFIEGILKVVCISNHCEAENILWQLGDVATVHYLTSQEKNI